MVVISGETTKKMAMVMATLTEVLTEMGTVGMVLEMVTVGSGGNGGGNGLQAGRSRRNVEIRTANGDLYATIIDIMSNDHIKPTLDSNGVWNGNKIVEKNHEDHEYEMIRSQMKTTKKSADRIHKKVKKGEGNIKAWVQSKITKATDYLDGVADYLDNKEE